MTLTMTIICSLGIGAGMESESNVSESATQKTFYHSDIHKLFSDLFRDYLKDIRPVHSHLDIINIRFELALFNVLALVSIN